MDVTALRAFVNATLAAEWGQRVQDRRRARHMTQAELADTVGCHRQTVSKIENGEIVARDEIKYAIAYALAADATDLFAAPTRRRLQRFAAKARVLA